MKLYLAFLALALLVSAEATKRHTTKNPHLGSEKLRIHRLSRAADYNAYVDDFLAEFSRIFNENGDSVQVVDDYGHFVADLNGTEYIIDFLLTEGVFSGLANTSRVGDALISYDEVNDASFLQFGIAFDPTQVSYHFSVRNNGGYKFEGNIEASVSTNLTQMGFLTDYVINHWIEFESLFFVFDLDSYEISWEDDIHPEVSDGIGAAVPMALLEGSTEIHLQFTQYLDQVLDVVGLPPHP